MLVFHFEGIIVDRLLFDKLVLNLIISGKSILELIGINFMKIINSDYVLTGCKSILLTGRLGNYRKRRLLNNNLFGKGLTNHSSVKME